MFPPSARAATIGQAPLWRGVYLRFPYEYPQKYYGWYDDLTGSMTGASSYGYGIQKDYLGCNDYANGESCECCGTSPYWPYPCNTCDFTFIYSNYFTTGSWNYTIQGRLSDGTAGPGWYHTTGNLKYSGWMSLIGTTYADLQTTNCNTGECATKVSQWTAQNQDGGLGHHIGIKYDGTIWSWGYGAFELGQDSSVSTRSSPVQIGTLNTWKNVFGYTSFGGNSYNKIYALKTDNTLWGWGYNNTGLGDITTINRSSPVQILSSVQHGATNGLTTHAIKTDGTLWAWGNNSYGMCGDNTTVNRSSPVQIGTDKWRALGHNGSGNPAYTVCAVRQDGTLWCWGYNVWGQVGDGTTTNRSSPVQVGTLSTWRDVSCSFYNTWATKIDGTLWQWGLLYHGIAAGTQRSSPVQIGSSTDYTVFPNVGPDNKYIALNNYKTMAYFPYGSSTRQTNLEMEGPYLELDNPYFRSKFYANHNEYSLKILKTGRGYAVY